MSEPEIAGKYLTRPQLAVLLGNWLRGKPYTETNIRLWERTGKAPPRIKVGNKTLYVPEDVDAWLRSQPRVR
ncbi:MULTISPECIES: hypothetical protein [unclassified Bradyrhizobium]|uniref:helix-turn-helix transcriptional regulator n=1 Tax=unclassified Bradyrhizobium TaxID=2631580 RepID=UPI0029165971|nr:MULTISPECIES: hypothetical protein [unclassified Bradyrhizobium]